MKRNPPPSVVVADTLASRLAAAENRLGVDSNKSNNSNKNDAQSPALGTPQKPRLYRLGIQTKKMKDLLKRFSGLPSKWSPNSPSGKTPFTGSRATPKYLGQDDHVVANPSLISSNKSTKSSQFENMLQSIKERRHRNESPVEAVPVVSAELAFSKKRTGPLGSTTTVIRGDVRVSEGKTSVNSSGSNNNNNNNNNSHNDSKDDGLPEEDDEQQEITQVLSDAEQAIKKRSELAQNPAILEELFKFWQIFEAIRANARDYIIHNEFVRMHRSLRRAISTQLTKEQAGEGAIEAWGSHTDYMRWDEFAASLFHLADLCTESTDPADYIDWLRGLYKPVCKFIKEEGETIPEDVDVSSGVSSASSVRSPGEEFMKSFRKIGLSVVENQTAMALSIGGVVMDDEGESSDDDFSDVSYDEKQKIETENFANNVVSVTAAVDNNQEQEQPTITDVIEPPPQQQQQQQPLKASPPAKKSPKLGPKSSSSSSMAKRVVPSRYLTHQAIPKPSKTNPAAQQQVQQQQQQQQVQMETIKVFQPKVVNLNMMQDEFVRVGQRNGGFVRQVPATTTGVWPELQHGWGHQPYGSNAGTPVAHPQSAQQQQQQQQQGTGKPKSRPIALARQGSLESHGIISSLVLESPIHRGRVRPTDPRVAKNQSSSMFQEMISAQLVPQLVPPSSVLISAAQQPPSIVPPASRAPIRRPYQDATVSKSQPDLRRHSFTMQSTTSKK